MTAEETYNELMEWWGNASGDLAYTLAEEPFMPSENDKLYLREYKESQATDKTGWLADRIYETPERLGMIADHLYDMVNGDREGMNQVYMYMVDNASHTFAQYAKNRLTN